MAGGVAENVYILACVFLLSISSSASYDEYTLENNKVCSLIRKRELKLGEKEHSAIIVKETRHFDNWSGQFAFDCNFTVLAPSDYGIITVIQGLELRKNETTGECIDYVQFTRRGGRKILDFFNRERIKSRKNCGKVEFYHLPASDDHSIEDTPNAFIDQNGHTDVTIHVANKPLQNRESLDLSIVFTAYLTCMNPPAGFRTCGRDICIWEGFFNDNYVNCPFPDCIDEGGCPSLIPGGKKQSFGLGTKVTIGAVVAILALLLLFLLCLCVCRHCQVLCWSGAQQSHSQRSSQQSARVEMTSHAIGSGNNSGHVQPTAPPLLSPSHPASSAPGEKDLPPPYESLFPSR